MVKSDRVERLKRKYGANIFVKWGREGGSPLLKAWEEGRVTIHKARKRKS